MCWPSIVVPTPFVLSPLNSGPWKSCNLTLCLDTNRRRELLADACTTGAIKTSCDFVSGEAVCSLLGLVQQTKRYSILSLGVANNGELSEEGMQDFITIPNFP